MKRTAILPFALALALVGVLGLSQNKEIPSRVGYIDAQKVIEAHPKYADIKALKEKADSELKPITDQLKAIEPKIRDGSASAKERQDFENLRKVYADISGEWQKKINTALTPITKEIDATIARVAAQNGFSMILSANVAGQSDLVVYASPDIDVTDLVIRALSAQ